MNREDPKERYAGQDKVTLGDDMAEGASIITPDAEDEIEEATREEMRLDDEQKARLREAAAASAVPLPSAPALPPGVQPDPYTLAILQSLQMTQQALLSFIKGQEEGKTIPYHLIKHDTPWNPEGKKNRTKLRRPTFLSGYPVNPMLHSEQEIELLNQLKPGRYNDRKWEVTRFEDGSIDVRYPNRTFEQRMEMALKAPDLSALCMLILTERKAQDERRARGLSADPDDDDQ